MNRFSIHSATATLIACLLTCVAHGQVQVSGVEAPLLENVLIHLKLDDEACDAPEWRVREQAERADAEIRTALEAYGYYGPRISFTLNFGEDCWTADIDIELGEPVRLRSVDISVSGEGSEDSIFLQMIEASGLEEGQPLLHGAYEELKRGLLDVAQRRGYAEADLAANRIDVFPLERNADVVLRLESGPRYTFGAITTSQDVLDPAILERYYEFRTGDPFHRSHLTNLYGALIDTSYFNSVDVRPQTPDRETKQIPIQINLTPASRLTLSYGVGYSTDTGPRLRAERNNRRVNDRGAQFGINGQLSPVISELSFNYRFPYGDPRSEWVSLDAGVKHEDTETAVSNTLELGIRRVANRRSGWQETRFVDLQIEDFEVADTKSRSRLLMPGMSWLRLEADNTLRPERGYRLGLEVTGAGDALGSDTSFMQVTAEAKWIRTFGNAQRLLVRGRLGAIWEDDFSKLPPSVRFFAGGDTSIRGYEFESLGPVDADGLVVGGNRLAIASIEYEFPIVRQWSAALFVDSGGAFRDNDFETSTGVGIGLRWRTPLGPIRVDLAKPLDGDDDDVRLHVSLGTDL